MKSRAAEIIKSAALTVLFASMVTLASFCIIMTQRYMIRQTASVPIDKLLVLRGGSGSPELNYDAGRLIPRFIGYSVGGSRRGISSNRDLIEDIYSSLSDYMKLLLGGGAVCSRVENGGEVWNDCINRSDYVYIKYHSAVPAPVIYAYITDETFMDSSKTAKGDTAYIGEMFILLDRTDDGRYSYGAVARDQNGNVVRYTPGRTSGESASGAKLYGVAASDSASGTAENYFDITALTVYDTSREFFKYRFAGASVGTSSAGGDGGYASLSLGDTAVLTDDDISCKLIGAENGLSETADVNIDALLKLFSYNPERLNKYTENNGRNMFFVETFGNLQISLDGGSIVFTGDAAAQNYKTDKAGIDVSEYLGYGSYSGEYNDYELLKSAEAFVTALEGIDGRLIGGDADVGLSRMYYDDVDLIIEYNYYFDNILLFGENSNPYTALRFTIRDNRFVKIEINTLDIVNRITKYINYSQSWTLQNIDMKLEKETGNNNSSAVYSEGDVRLAYIIAPPSASGTSGDNKGGVPETSGAADTAAAAASSAAAGTDSTCAAEAGVSPQWIYIYKNMYEVPLTNELEQG